ncbi:acyl-CoA carboxylase subunit epsilon [Corynebacterium frankenforstense]|uniref:acyl-CoA carboxylase subunit epsilon n=1 Tax=Corynebacterium frankenforstense TaxID=1230998 RepID=UPI0026E9DE9E|nr:acyl-CoA carboxylase subunit epsilon [Corynebacterium frankenforstense]
MSSLFTVTKGAPTADELAALATVVAVGRTTAAAAIGTPGRGRVAARRGGSCPAGRNGWAAPGDMFSGISSAPLPGVSYI